MNNKSNDESLCDFCLSSKSKYCCSRCHRKYCSSDCFKCLKHIQCSEEFFKQCVTEELVSQRFDDSSKHKLLEILQRNDKQLLDHLEEDIEDEDQGVDTIESRFNDLDLCDSRLLWNKLSDSEKQEFNQLLKSGQIEDIIELWNPWWKTYDYQLTHNLVQPLNQMTSTQKTKDDTKLPDLISNIFTLNDLISKPVSPSVCPAVVNTLLSYCYVCRVFNGEYDSIEAIQTFISKCPQLSDNINCDDLSKSIEMSVQQIMIEQPSHLAIELLRDVKCLIEGPKLRTQSLETPEYVLRALSDLISVIISVKKKISKLKKKEMKIDLLVKKLEFYLSWSVANGSSLFDCLNQINLIIETMHLSEETNRSVESSDDLRTKLKPKTLIQEINSIHS